MMRSWLTNLSNLCKGWPRFEPGDSSLCGQNNRVPEDQTFGFQFRLGSHSNSDTKSWVVAPLDRGRIIARWVERCTFHTKHCNENLCLSPTGLDGKHVRGFPDPDCTLLDTRRLTTSMLWQRIFHLQSSLTYLLGTDTPHGTKSEVLEGPCGSNWTGGHAGTTTKEEGERNKELRPRAGPQHWILTLLNGTYIHTINT